MKTEDNNNGKKGVNKRMLVIGGAAALICIIAVAALALRPAGSEDMTAADNTPVSDNTAEIQTPNDNETVSSNTEEDEKTETIEVTTDDAAPIQQVSINYASAESDEESLKQLVKDTIQSAGIQMEEARENGGSYGIDIVINAVEDARQRDDLASTFAPLGDSVNPLPDENQNWTYMEVSGAVGGLLFNERDLSRNIMQQSDLLKNFVANGVYTFDCDNVEINEVKGIMETYFADVATGNYDVNFEVNMKYDDVEWIALVGNVDGLYRVLDVVKAEDLGNYVVYYGKEEEEEEETTEVVSTEAPQQEVANEEQVEVVEQSEEIVINEESENSGIYNQVFIHEEGDGYDPWVGYPNYTGPREGYFYDHCIHDYRPNSEAGTPANNLMGNAPSTEEYDAAGGTHCGY